MERTFEIKVTYLCGSMEMLTVPAGNAHKAIVNAVKMIDKKQDRTGVYKNIKSLEIIDKK